MRWSFALVFLFVLGCGSGSERDTIAARDFVRGMYRSADAITIEEPEYVAIPKIPRKISHSSAVRSAVCAVRVRFRWHDGGRTTNDDWVVWVTSDHKAVDWSGNPDGDNWRRYVGSFARK